MRRRLRQAWDDPEHGRALGRLEQIATELSHSHPEATASLREGMAETLTLTRLGISGPLTRTRTSPNPIESMIACVRRTARNVKRWQSGEMARPLDRRRDAQGLSASSGGSSATSSSATLARASERDLAPPMTTKEVATPVTA